MPLLTLQSPGVSTREIDLSSPTQIVPSGVPAGVVGTSLRGPAFVPITVATFRDFVARFGNTDGEKFGPLAMNEWLRNAGSGTYVRILGIGDGKRRTSGGNNAGKVANAGFVVGSSLVQSNGIVGSNSKANSSSNIAGRTYFLGSFMSESAGSTVLQDAGLVAGASPTAVGILRGVLMAASGVALTLTAGGLASPATKNAVSTDGSVPGGHPYGDIYTASNGQEFVMLLNGHDISDESANVLTASFDPYAPNYFGRIFNRDPNKLEDMGYYLHSHYDVYASHLVHTASGLRAGGEPTDAKGQTAFLLSGSSGWNTGSASTATYIGAPNFEGFEDRFRTAVSPFVISQKFGGVNRNLFRVHSLDDGKAGSDTFKITIENIKASSNENNPFGSFDLLVRYFADSDEDPMVLEAFRGLDLNPSSDNFISRRIGDTHRYYDFDKAVGGQKLVIEGKYPNVSNYIRIEASQEVDEGTLNDTSLPVGFRGIRHLVTSGSIGTGELSPVSGTSPNVLSTPGNDIKPIGTHFVQPPIPMRESLSKGSGVTKTLETKLTWGIQFQKKEKAGEPNNSQNLNESIRSYIAYFPNFHTNWQNPLVGENEGTPDKSGAILDADRFNNNIFTLERVQVLTGSNDRPDPTQWVVSSYKRNGSLDSTISDSNGLNASNLRFINPSTDFSHPPSKRFLKFTFPLQGGFDGVNIFDRDKSKFTDAALRREIDDSTNQGGTSGPTVTAYRKGITVMEEKTDVDIQLLAVPGARHSSVSDFAIDSVERRFDAMYVMDIEERDTFNAAVTGSTEVINVRNTVNNHAARSLDTSFAAAYFPDVIINDPTTLTNVTCPPSVAVLGALSYNDAVAHPWYAPAGFNRGALQTGISGDVLLNNANLDDLYSVDINPITKFPSTGLVIWGQKTLLANQSALDRVNVRRLLIDIRRQVKNVANSLLFEANREETLSRFRNAVTPILSRIQQQQGLDRFTVQIDTTTTTQADVENNTIRGKIYLQPTRSIEFISLDFAVTNAGAEV